MSTTTAKNSAASARASKMISFEELVEGSEAVRVEVGPPPLIWAVELVMAITGKKNNAANEVLRDIDPDLFDSEKIVLKKLPGNGKWPVKLLTFKDAMDLIMVLPGPHAKLFRQQACDILTRFLAGDPSLHAEINANARSQEPIHEFARASLPEPPRDAMLEQFLAVNAQSVSNASSLITTNAQLVGAHERASLANARQAELFGEQIRAAAADLEKERHLRHQADGRYGSGIREATKEVRKRAADSDARAVAAEARAAEDRREHHKAIRDAAERAVEDRREHYQAVRDAAEGAAEERRAAATASAEERRAAAASHQLLAETLAKLAARLM
jgi:hypothetical protein